MHRLHPAGFDRRDQGRVGVERPVLADLAFEAQGFAVGGQQQLDGGGVETDAVVQPLHAVFGVDALDRHHGHQHLDLADLRRVPGEQRFDHIGRGRHAPRSSTQSPGMSTRGTVSTNLVDLGDHDAAAEGRGLHDGGGVFGVGAGVEVALGVGAVRGDQRDLGREVHEVAGEQLQVGVDGTDLDAAPVRPDAPGGRFAGRRRRSPACWRCRARRCPGARAATAPTAPCAGRAPAPHPPAAALGPGSRPASGCCPPGRPGRPVPARHSAASGWPRLPPAAPSDRCPGLGAPGRAGPGAGRFAGSSWGGKVGSGMSSGRVSTGSTSEARRALQPVGWRRCCPMAGSGSPWCLGKTPAPVSAIKSIKSQIIV